MLNNSLLSFLGKLGTRSLFVDSKVFPSLAALLSGVIVKLLGLYLDVSLYA